MIAAHMMTECNLVLKSGVPLAKAVRLMADRPASAVPVVCPDNRLSGVVSAASIVRAAFASAAGPDGLAGFMEREAERPVDDFMDREYASIGPEAGLKELSSIFTRSLAAAVMVVDGSGRLLGVIRPTDVLKRLCEYSERKKR